MGKEGKEEGSRLRTNFDSEWVRLGRYGSNSTNAAQAEPSPAAEALLRPRLRVSSFLGCLSAFAFGQVFHEHLVQNLADE